METSDNFSIRALAIGSKEPEIISLQQFLEERGFKLIAFFEKGQEGIDQVKHLRPNIVFVDASTSDMDSVDVANALRVVDPTLKIIMLSVANNPEWLQMSIDAGATNFLTKPLFRDDVYEVIKSAFQNR